MKKVSGIVDIGEVVLKYQLVPEDLDTLVAVRTEEDVKHMMEEEQNGHGGSVGSPMLRAFLFPKKQPVLVDNNNQQQQQQAVVPNIEPYWLEQRYIDAINGIIRTSPRSSPRGAYSACCSPKSNSPDAPTADSPFNPSSHSLNQNRMGHHLTTIHKVHSSPNLSNLTSTSTSNNNHHHHHPPPLHYPSRQLDPQIGILGIGGAGGRVPPPPPPVTIDRGGFNFYYSTATRQQHKPSAYHEDSAAPYATASTNVMMERLHSVPRRSRSPRNTFWE